MHDSLLVSQSLLKMAEVLVVGDIMVDVVVAMESEFHRGSDTKSTVSMSVGGTAVNVATWAMRSSTNVKLVGCIGDDSAGELITEHLKSWGISASLKVITDAPSGMVVALAHPDGERSMFPDSRANKYLTFDQFAHLAWSDIKVFYISGYTLFNQATRALGLQLMQLARTAGSIVVLDPASAAPLRKLESEILQSWLEQTDVLLPNHDEFIAIQNNLGFTVAQINELCPTIVTKQGASGAEISQEGKISKFAGMKVEVTDSVGAGDSFAGTLIANLANNQQLEKAVQSAIQASAFSVTLRGAQPVLP
jgi:ribokinase